VRAVSRNFFLFLPPFFSGYGAKRRAGDSSCRTSFFAIGTPFFFLSLPAGDIVLKGTVMRQFFLFPPSLMWASWRDAVSILSAWKSLRLPFLPFFVLTVCAVETASQAATRGTFFPLLMAIALRPPSLQRCGTLGGRGGRRRRSADLSTFSRNLPFPPLFLGPYGSAWWD